MMLTTIQYYKGTWKNNFEESIDVFKVPGSGGQKVAFLTSTNYYSYSINENLSAQVVQIPYKVSCELILENVTVHSRCTLRQSNLLYRHYQNYI